MAAGPCSADRARRSVGPGSLWQCLTGTRSDTEVPRAPAPLGVARRQARDGRVRPRCSLPVSGASRCHASALPDHVRSRAERTRSLTAATGGVSRRWALKASGAAGATALVSGALTGGAHADDGGDSDARRRGRGVEPDAGTGSLGASSGMEIHVPPPPTGRGPA